MLRKLSGVKDGFLQTMNTDYINNFKRYSGWIYKKRNCTLQVLVTDSSQE